MTEKQWQEYLASLPRVEKLPQNNITETERMILDCFANCGSEWNSLKAAMLNDPRLKRRIQESSYDENGICKVIDNYI